MASLANDKMQDDDSTTMVGGAAEFVSDDKSEINDQPRAPSPIPTPVSSPPSVTPLKQQVYFTSPSMNQIGKCQFV